MLRNMTHVKLQDYYDYLLCFGHPGPDLMRHVQELPPSLGTDMATELYKNSVARIPLFYGVKTAFLESLIRGLNLCVFLKGALYVQVEWEGIQAENVSEDKKQEDSEGDWLRCRGIYIS